MRAGAGVVKDRRRLSRILRRACDGATPAACVHGVPGRGATGPRTGERAPRPPLATAAGRHFNGLHPARGAGGDAQAGTGAAERGANL